jgi:hypothetical protein
MWVNEVNRNQELPMLKCSINFWGIHFPQPAAAHIEIYVGHPDKNPGRFYFDNTNHKGHNFLRTIKAWEDCFEKFAQKFLPFFPDNHNNYIIRNYRKIPMGLGRNGKGQGPGYCGGCERQ